MTLITMQGDAVVMRNGKIGTEQECCCQKDFCDEADQASQPSVVVTGSTCSCETGTINGTYPFAGFSGIGGYYWQGTTNCDVQEDAFGTVFLAPISVGVSCELVVFVSTYELGEGGFPTGMTGTEDGSTSLSVDEDGHITGQVTVNLSGAAGDTCSVTVTFG